MKLKRQEQEAIGAATQQQLEVDIQNLFREKGAEAIDAFLNKQLDQARGHLHLRQKVRTDLYWHKILNIVQHVLDNITVTRWFCPPDAYPDASWCEAEIRGPRSGHILTLDAYYGGHATIKLSWGDNTEVNLDDFEHSIIQAKVLDIMAFLGYYDVTVNDFLYLLAAVAGASGACWQMWVKGITSGGERKALPQETTDVVESQETESN